MCASWLFPSRPSEPKSAMRNWGTTRASSARPLVAGSWCGNAGECGRDDNCMEILLPAERIQTRVAELARQISADYKDRPVTIVGVLTGCLMFLADLVRHLDLPLRISLIKASSYRGAVTTPGQLSIHPDLLSDIHDRHVLLLDDILDTG